MKNKIFKKSISLMLTVLMIMSCWVFFPGMVPEVEAASTEIKVTTSFTLSPNGNRGNDGSWTRLALTGESAAGGTSVVLFRFTNADLKNLADKDEINLQFYAYSCNNRLSHNNVGVTVNADIYYITKNSSFVSGQGTNKSTNVADTGNSVLGTDYTYSYAQDKAKSYFGLSDNTLVGSFEQPTINGQDNASLRTGDANYSYPVTEIVKQKAASDEDLSFIVMLRQGYSCSGDRGWSDIYIDSSTISLSGYNMLEELKSKIEAYEGYFTNGIFYTNLLNNYKAYNDAKRYYDAVTYGGVQFDAAMAQSYINTIDTAIAQTGLNDTYVDYLNAEVKSQNGTAIGADYRKNVIWYPWDFSWDITSDSAKYEVQDTRFYWTMPNIIVGITNDSETTFPLHTFFWTDTGSRWLRYIIAGSSVNNNTANNSVAGTNDFSVAGNWRVSSYNNGHTVSSWASGDQGWGDWIYESGYDSSKSLDSFEDNNNNLAYSQPWIYQVSNYATINKTAVGVNASNTYGKIDTGFTFGTAKSANGGSTGFTSRYASTSGRNGYIYVVYMDTYKNNYQNWKTLIPAISYKDYNGFVYSDATNVTTRLDDASGLLLNLNLTEAQRATNIDSTVTIWATNVNRGANSLASAKAAGTTRVTTKYVDLIDAISNSKATYAGGNTKYTYASWNNFVAAYNAAKEHMASLNPDGSNVQYSSNATEIGNLATALNNAKAALKERTYDVTYENMFSFSSWANSASGFIGTPAKGTMTYDVNAGTITFANDANNTQSNPNDHYTSYGFGNDHYNMTLVPGETYTFEYTTSGGTGDQVHIFFYDDNGNAVANKANGGSPFAHAYGTGRGTHTISFTAPENATKAAFRFGSTVLGDSITFSNIYMYSHTRGDYADIANWTDRPNRTVFNYGQALGTTLEVPTRPGHTFDGWWVDSINPNGQKDEGEQVTDDSGTVVTNLQNFGIAQDWILYSEWTVNKYTVTFETAYGTTTSAQYDYGTPADSIVKPANTAANYDENNHYAYSWPAISDVTGDVTYKEVKTPTAHSYSESITTAPTCTTEGVKTYTCNCGYSYTDAIDKAAHTPGAAATCTAPQTCTVCGTELAPKLAHTEEIIPAVPATCTVPGKTAGKKCSVCGVILVAQTDTALADHTEATREEDRVEATCGKDGSYKLVTYCSVCSTVIKTEAKTIAATGNHTWNDGEITVEPTCQTEGTKTYTCTAENCGATYTETVAKLAHNYTNPVITRPTQNTDGTWTDGKYTYTCSNGCNGSIEEVAKRADYTELEAAVSELQTLNNNEKLNADAKAEIAQALAKANALADDLVTSEQPQIDELVKELLKAKAHVEEILENVGKPQPITEAVSGLKVQFLKKTGVEAIDSVQLNANGGFDTARLKLTNNNKDLPITVVGITSNKTATYLDTSDTPSANSVSGIVIDVDKDKDLYIGAPASFKEAGLITYTITYKIGSDDTGYLMDKDGNAVEFETKAYIYVKGAAFTPYHFMDERAAWPLTATSKWQHYFEAVNYGDFELVSYNTASKFSDKLEVGTSNFGFRHDAYDYCEDGCQAGCKNNDYATGDAHAATYKFYVDTSLAPTWEAAGFRVRITETAESVYENAPLKYVRLAVNQAYLDGISGSDKTFKTTFVPSPSSNVPNKTWIVTSSGTLDVSVYENPDRSEYLFGEHKNKTSFDETSAYVNFSGSIPVDVTEAKFMFSPRIEFNGKSSSESVTMTSHIWLTSYDKGALRAAVNAAEQAAYNPNYYDSDKYEAYQNALMAAKEVLGKAETTQDEVDEKLAALNTAVTELVKAENRAEYVLTVTHSIRENADMTAEPANKISYYLLEKGSTFTVPYDAIKEDASKINKYDDEATLTITDTAKHTYNYWYINYSKVQDALDAAEEILNDTTSGYSDEYIANVKEAEEALEKILEGQDATTTPTSQKTVDDAVKAVTDLTGHECNEDVKISGYASTCIAEGLTDGTKCSVCGVIKTAQTTIPASGHNFRETVAANAATCIAPGNKAYKQCTACNLYFAENAETNAADGKEDTTSFVINKLDHAYTGEYQWNNSVTPKTHSQKCVNGCNEYGSETVCTFDEVVTPPTCYNGGYTTYTCTVCNNSYQADYTTREHVYVYAPGNGTSHTVTCKYNDCDYTATENCSGGTATCTTKATCEKCNTAWGELDAENHASEETYVDGYDAATCTTPGKTGDTKYECCNAVKIPSEVIPVDKDAHTGTATVIKNDKEATCLDKGYTGDTYWSCCDALEVKGQEISANGHTFGTPVAANAATCIATGNKAYKQCTVCNLYFAENAGIDSAEGKDSAEAFTTQIDSNNHENTTEHEATTETCTTVGYTAGTYCDDCKKWISGHDEIEAIGHKNKIHRTKVEATCVAEGTVEYWECPDCKKNFSDENCTAEVANLTIAINPDNHDLKTTNAKTPTCTEIGWDAYVTCQREGCGYTTYAEKSALGHDYGKWEYVEGTDKHQRVCANDTNHVETEPCADSANDSDCNCDKCGNLVAHSYGDASCDAPATCTVCGETTGSALGHDYTVFVETVDYTCTAGGYDVYKCSRCDATEHKNLTAAAHRPEADYTVIAKATCEKDGYKAILCSKCKEELETETIAKREHVYKDNGVKTPATCLADGVMNTICTNVETDTHAACAHESTRVIDKLGHDKVTHEAKTPTCTEIGWDAYETCKREGCGYTTYVEKPALGHEFTKETATEDYLKTAATCNDVAVYYKSCSRCGLSSKDQTGEATFESGAELGHAYDLTKGTSNNNGKHTVTCTRCEEGTEGHTDIVDCTYGAGVVTAPTCTKDGYTTHTCTICSYSYEDTVTGATGHSFGSWTANNDGTHTRECTVCSNEEGRVESGDCTYGEWTETKAPTCLDDGEKAHTCSVCKNTVTEVIPAKGHTFGDTTAAKEETCIATGNEAYKQCTACNKFFAADAANDSADGKADTTSFVIAIDPAKHTKLTKTDAVENTCETDGNIDYWTCDGCNNIYKDAAATQKITKDETIVAAKGHDYDKSETEANLTRPVKNSDGTWEKGYYTFTCKNDSSHKDYKFVERADYNNYEAARNNLEGLLNTDLTDEAKEAIREVLEENEIADNLIASEQDVVEKAEDNLKDCFEQYKGSLKTYTVIFVVAGKQTKTTVVSGNSAVAPTDTNKDRDDTYHYVFAGWDTEFTNITSDLTVTAKFDAVEHVYTTHTDKDDTYHTDKCDCGYSKDVKHTETSEVTTKATCEADGVKTYTCSVCQGTRTEAIAKRDHVYEDNGVKTPATCLADGVMNTICTNKETDTHAACTHESTRAIIQLSHSYTGEIKSDGNGKDATHSYKCVNGCNEYGAAVKHTWNDGEVTTPATCLDKGVKTYTCAVSGCGATYTEDVNANGHTFGTPVAANAATCIATGNEAYKQCTVCKLYFAADAETNAADGKADTTSFVIKKLDHSYTGEIKSDGNGKDATHSYKCVNGCNEYGAAIEHTWNGGEVTTPATCLGNGVKTYTCTVSGCGATYTEDVNANGHTFGDTTTANAATCIATGNKAYKQCTVCNLYFAENAATNAADGKEDTTSFVIKKLDHSYTGEIKSNGNGKDATHSYKCVNGCNGYGNETVCTFDEDVTAPTCSANGYTTYTCTVCNNSYKDNYTTRDHVYVYAPGNGTSHTVTCKYNDCDYTATENCSGGTATCTTKATCEKCNTAWGEELGHQWSAAGYTWSKAESWSCVAARECGRADCDAKETATATITSAEKTAATCTEDGWTTYTAIFAEEWTTTQYKDVQDIPALTHDWSDWSFDADGKHKRVCANDTNHVETEACADADGDNNCNCDKCDNLVAHKYVDASCDAPATCTECGETTGDKLGHSFTNYVSDGNATCAKDGTKTAKCDRCDKTYTVTDIGSALDHAYGDWEYVDGTGTHQRVCANDPSHVETANCSGDIEYTGASCTKTGIRIISCNVCGGKETIEYPALGHEFIDDENYTVVIEATCTQVGSVNLKCVRCDELKYMGIVPAKGHRFFKVTEAIAPTCTTPGRSDVERCLSCNYEEPAEIYPATGHSIKDGKCVTCGAKEYEGDQYCSCICHNDSMFMRFIYMIVRFFWRIFRMNKSCDCGAVHY